MKTSKAMILGLVTLAIVTLMLMLPTVVAATSQENDAVPTNQLTASIRCASVPGENAESVLHIESSESGELTGSVYGHIDKGPWAGLTYTSSAHPGGGPQFWRLSVGDDPSLRGEVVEFWAWVKVLEEPYGTPDGSEIPTEFPLKVRLIDGGSEQADDWVQLYAGGSTPLLASQPGCEECRLQGRGVEVNWDPTF